MQWEEVADGGGASGAGAVLGRSRDHDDRGGDPPRLHDVSEQARPLLIVLVLLQTDVVVLDIDPNPSYLFFFF